MVFVCLDESANAQLTEMNPGSATPDRISSPAGIGSKGDVTLIDPLPGGIDIDSSEGKCWFGRDSDAKEMAAR